MKKPNVVVEIIEDERTCANCAIRHEQRKMLKENDAGLMGHSVRYCMPCKRQANRGIIDSLMGMFPSAKPEVVDNWRPVEGPSKEMDK